MADVTPFIHPSAPELGDWPQPQEIPVKLKPVPAFDYELLPESLRGWVSDIAERMQCAPDYPAVSVMVALSSLIGRKVGIRPKAKDDGFEVIPNLWGCLIGRPSELKSPAMAEALKPLRKLEAEAAKEFEQAEQLHVADIQLANLNAKDVEARAKKAVKAGNQELAHALLLEAEQAKPEEPTRTRHIVTDATVEKLGELLNQNPNGVLLARDELAGWLKSLDREDRSNDRAFYLEAFNGNGRYTYDRIGRGTLDIPALCVSLLGTIQPGKLLPYIRNAVGQGLTDDGLVQRLQLAVMPDKASSWTYQDRYPNKVSRERAYDVFQAMADLTPPEPLEGDSVYWVRFNDEAQAMFIEWLTELEQEIRSEDIHPALEAHFAKYRSLAPSLALVIHLAETGEPSRVTATAFARAAEWCEYLKQHAARLYGMGTNPEIDNARTILTKIKARKLSKDGKTPSTVKPRDIQQKQWAGISDSNDVQAALSVLEDYGWVRLEVSSNPAGGRPSLAYQLHPSLTGERHA